MNWRGIELERDGQGWRATEDGVFLQVNPVVPPLFRRAGWMARLETSYGSSVSGYGPTPEEAMAKCDQECREMAAELLKGLGS